MFVLIQSLLFSVVNHGTNKEFHQTNKMMAYFKVFSLFCLCVICSSFSSAQQFWFKFRRFPPAMNGNKTLGTPQEKIAYQPRTTESMLAHAYRHRLAVPRISFYTSRHTTASGPSPAPGQQGAYAGGGPPQHFEKSGLNRKF
jgi:hypothetical protein